MIGIHKDGSTVFLAKMRKTNKSVSIDTLFSSSEGNVKRFLFGNTKDLACALEAKDVLIKNIAMDLPPHTSYKKVLAYQMESLHFFSPDETISLSIFPKKPTAGSLLANCFTTTKKQLKRVISSWKSLDLEPSYISTVPSALLRYSEHYHNPPQDYYIVHLGLKTVTCVWIENRNVKKAHSFAIGISSILETARKCGNSSLDSFFSTKEKQAKSQVMLHVEELVSSIKRAFVAFSPKGKLPLLLTGQLELSSSLTDYLLQSFSPFVTKTLGISSNEKKNPELKKYAISIGLVLDVTKNDTKSLQFRKGEFLAEKFWKKRFWQMSTFLLLSSLLFFCSYFSLSEKLSRRKATLEKKIKQELFLENEKYDRKIVEKNSTLALASWERAIDREKKMPPFFTEPPKVLSILSWIKEPLKNEEAFLESFSFVLEERPSVDRPFQPHLARIELAFRSSSKDAIKKITSFFLEKTDKIDRQKPLSSKEEDDKCFVSFYMKKGALS